jgi:ABC-type Co2+ transport system permease subunit
VVAEEVLLAVLLVLAEQVAAVQVVQTRRERQERQTLVAAVVGRFTTLAAQMVVPVS